MKIVSDWSHDCNWGVVPYVQKSLDKYSEEESDSVLMNGAAWLYEKSLREKYKDPYVRAREILKRCDRKSLALNSEETI